VAKKMADDFFAAFNEKLAGGASATSDDAKYGDCAVGADGE